MRNLRVLLTLFAVFFFTYSGIADVNVKVRVYLEGPAYNSFDVGETHGRPLMRDDLRSHPVTLSNYIPVADIYQTPYQITDLITVDVTDKFTHVGCGTYSQYAQIGNPGAVFSVTGENAIVDWVFVELRSTNDMSQVIATRSGLLQRDGDVVDLDGVSSLFFDDVPEASYMVAVRHRNHLGVMTLDPQTPEEMADLVDFSSYGLSVYDFGMADGMFDYTGLAMGSINLNGTEVRTLWAGDFDADGMISFHGQVNDLQILQKEVASYDLDENPLYQTEFNGAYGYLQSDYDLNGQAKFSAPNDDQNFLLAQVTFYELNQQVITNFVHIVQQLP